MSLLLGGGVSSLRWASSLNVLEASAFSAIKVSCILTLLFI